MTAEYPFIPTQYGIPFPDFPLGFDEPIVSPSGRELSCTIGKRLIIVEDVEDRWFRMSAYVNPKGVLSFDLETRRSSTSEVHPDMFAALFIDYAFQHFEHNNVEIIASKGEYFGDDVDISTNYEQFWTHYRISKNKKEAARQTWYGQIMSKYGFTEINYVKCDKTEDKVVIKFCKEDIY